MKTVFSNPFDSTELNERVDGVVLKIGPLTILSLELMLIVLKLILMNVMLELMIH
jgi:hypothetical protein